MFKSFTPLFWLHANEDYINSTNANQSTMLGGMNSKHALLIVSLSAILSTLFFGIVYSDSKIYIHMTRYFLGIASAKGVEGWISSRPLVPLLAAFPSIFLWIPVAYGILNSIFWVLSSLLLYQITRQLTDSQQNALAAALFFTASPPTLLYFGSVMLESGSTFFALLILWTYLRLQNRLHKPKSLLLGALAGIGILSKETTLPVIVAILLLSIVLHRFKPTLLWVLLLIIPSIVWQGYTTLTWGENYWTHYVRAGLEYSERRYGTSFYANVVDIAKALALSHFPLAIISLIIGFFSVGDRRQNLIFYSLLLPALSAYLLWPFRDLRIGVVSYYATMPLAGIGVDYIVKSLKQKPLICRIDSKTIYAFLYIIHIIGSILYVYNSLGTFSPPWNIYLFAPSSLKAGL
jgi:hypothetical protein